MDSDTIMEPMDLKVRELLKEVQLDYSSATTKLVDDTVSAIKQAIDTIPEDLKVFSPFLLKRFFFQNPSNFVSLLTKWWNFDAEFSIFSLSVIRTSR